MAATARLHKELGWPREQLIVESPDLTGEGGRSVLRREALDILTLQAPCASSALEDDRRVGTFPDRSQGEG